MRCSNDLLMTLTIWMKVRTWLVQLTYFLVGGLNFEQFIQITSRESITKFRDFAQSCLIICFWSSKYMSSWHTLENHKYINKEISIYSVNMEGGEKFDHDFWLKSKFSSRWFYHCFKQGGCLILNTNHLTNETSRLKW